MSEQRVSDERLQAVSDGEAHADPRDLADYLLDARAEIGRLRNLLRRGCGLLAADAGAASPDWRDAYVQFAVQVTEHRLSEWSKREALSTPPPPTEERR